MVVTEIIRFPSSFRMQDLITNSWDWRRENKSKKTKNTKEPQPTHASRSQRNAEKILTNASLLFY